VLELAAPPGQPLVPGTYTGAVRAPFRGPGQPGIDISGNGRGCNVIAGTFTVNTAVYGPNNYVQTFDATFQQHCDGAAPALVGEISVANPSPAPGELAALLTAVTGVGPGKSLSDKVRQIQAEVAANDTTDACANLAGFIGLVTAQNNKQIAPTLAASFIAQAQAIETAIGC
jgi:hypothetical protein